MACSAIAIVTHYFWLAAFTWMMLFAFNIAKTFSGTGIAAARPKGGGSFWKYMILGWTNPSAVVGICIGLHLCQCTPIVFEYGNLEENTCFIRGSKAVLFTFVVPVSALLLLSISCFIFMAIHLRRQRSAGKLARRSGAAKEISYEVAIYLRVRNNF